MAVRAKFYVKSKQLIADRPNGGKESERVVLVPTYGESEENKSFSKYTPNGHIELDITNPDAFNQFKIGKEYYIDFKACEEEAAEKVPPLETEHSFKDGDSCSVCGKTGQQIALDPFDPCVPPVETNGSVANSDEPPGVPSDPPANPNEPPAAPGAGPVEGGVTPAEQPGATEEIAPS